MNLNQLVSVLGLAAMLVCAWLLCRKKSSIHWRPIVWGIGLQFVFAILILKTTPGNWVFSVTNDFVTKLLAYQEEGAKFVFGSLAIPPGSPNSLGFFFAFQVLTTIVFLSSLMSILYYLGLMQKIVLFFARIMTFTCRTSGSETLNAAANIFMGQTEAPLLVRPYLDDMTESELLCVMIAGMATISGGIMVAYVGMLKPYYPDVAGHFLAAQVMSAIGALVITKLMVPETGHPKTMGTLKVDYHEPAVNVIDAAGNGASLGMQLALNVAAMLVAFLSLLAMANGLVHYIGGWFSFPDLSLEMIFGWVLSPLAWIMGVPWHDCQLVGRLIGEKAVLNEFVAYLDLSTWAGAHATAPLAYRSYVIAVYALCGFANFSSIAIQIGGIGPMAPKRKGDLARLGLYALIGGTLTSYLSATIAGILIP